MGFDFFSILIYLLLVVLIYFSLKVFLDTRVMKQNAIKKYLLIEDQLKFEKENTKINIEKIQLSDSLSDSVIKRLFIITREILLLQKMIMQK